MADQDSIFDELRKKLESGVITPPSGAWARARVTWHQARAQLRSKRWWATTILVLVFWIAVGWPLYAAHPARGFLHTCLAMLFVLSKARVLAAPSQMQVVEREYKERKTVLYQLLKQLQYEVPMSDASIGRYQQTVLSLIACYVRSHRADRRGQEIFVNLLIEDGDDLRVVARDSDHRVPLASYPKLDMIAWRAIRDGAAKCTGDVRKLDPLHDPTREYASILVIPVMGSSRVLGAVSIDSKRLHHFDGEWDKLEQYLLPYTCLLAWTLEEQHMFREVSA